MLYCSPRLLANGYYNPKDPTIRQICYKETPRRIFKKRKRKHRVGGSCLNLISEFDEFDFQSLENECPMLTSEIFPQHASPPIRCFLVVRKMVLLPLLLCLLGFGVWFCYTGIGKHLVQPTRYLTQATYIQNQARLLEELQKLAIRLQRLEQKDVDELIRRALSLYRADGIGMADYALESLGKG